MNSLPQQRNYFIGFFVIGSMLAMSVYLQQKGIVPCPLCILQRLTLSMLGLFFLFGVACKIKFCRISTGIVSALLCILGIILAGRQVWLQHDPQSVHGSCEVSLQYMLQTFPLKDVLVNIFQGSAPCSEVGWEFLRLSLAEWSLIFFTIFLLFSLWQLRKG